MSRTFRTFAAVYWREVEKEFKHQLTNNFVISANFAAFITCHCVYALSTSKDYVMTVKDKYTFTTNGFTHFMVIDEDGKHYEVNNSFWYLKWDSIEDWNKINVNDSILIKYYGFRIPVLGVFPNIVETKLCKKMQLA